MEKFKTLFKNEQFEIVQITRKTRNGKTCKSFYVDFGKHDCGAGWQICTVDFQTKAELKSFIKDYALENYFTKSFLRG